MSAAFAIRDVTARLASDMPALLHALIGEQPTTRSRDALRFRARGSLCVLIAGPRRGSWFDHEAGVGGDALGLVAHARRSSMREAWAWASNFIGASAGSAEVPPQRRKALEPSTPTAASGTTDLARRIWAEAVTPRGTLVERYLAHRGLELAAYAPLRFHPACPRGAERLPAMVALMTDPCTAEPVGVHRTFLAVDGAGKAQGNAKQMAGRVGVVRLSPDAEVTQGLGLAEGIETALAVTQRLGWTPVWAATSAGAIARFPVLAGIEELTVWADADDRGVGLAGAVTCAERWAEMARLATIIEAPAGTDFDAATRRVA